MNVTLIKKLRLQINSKILSLKIKWAVGLLRSLNSNMKKMGWSRQVRRQFWREFSKSKELQEEIFNGILKENK